MEQERQSAAEPRYIINLSSHYSEVEAAAEQGRLARLGVETEIKQVMINDRTWYRLRCTEQVEKSKARAYVQSLKELTGLQDIWLEPAR